MTGAGAGAGSSAMFTDRGPLSPSRPTAARGDRVAVLYTHHAAAVRRIVARHVTGAVEDACQVAWERLLTHPEVDLDGRGVIAWLVVTATREAWRQGSREVPLSALAPDADDDVEAWLPGSASDPIQIVTQRDTARRRLAGLTGRERQFLGLQAQGYSYTEIADLTGASLRTVERQLLRAARKLRANGS